MPSIGRTVGSLFKKPGIRSVGSGIFWYTNAYKKINLINIAYLLIFIKYIIIILFRTNSVSM
jgi:hypothetical protein